MELKLAVKTKETPRKENVDIKYNCCFDCLQFPGPARRIITAACMAISKFYAKHPISYNWDDRQTETEQISFL